MFEPGFSNGQLIVKSNAPQAMQVKTDMVEVKDVADEDDNTILTVAYDDRVSFGR